jgi:hypothetical protein
MERSGETSAGPLAKRVFGFEKHSEIEKGGHVTLEMGPEIFF